MTLSHIVAVSENDVIGTNNTLPWDIPEDMRFFREKTKGHALIMGRKTYESMGRPLPHRLNVVVTRQKNYAADADNLVIKADLKSAIAHCASVVSKYGDEIFIIGGGEIFAESMDLVNLIYLTRIHRTFGGTVYYPKIDPLKFTLAESRERHSPVPFTFQTFARIN